MVRKIFSLLLIATFLIVPMQHVSANTYARLAGNTHATVIQVIDGEALRVQPLGTNQIALVRLAGVLTHGRRDAQDFITGALLGRQVEVTLSMANAPSDRFDDRWTPVYITLNNEIYNRVLVQRGLADVDPAYAGHWLYSTLLEDSGRAQQAQFGMWEDTGFRTAHAPRMWRGSWGTFPDERVNINTATTSQINNVLYDTSYSVGRDIVRFRHHSPFQHVGEVKFADVFTREEFDELWVYMKVSTNINTATEEELMQLIDVTRRDARAIIDFRNRQWFSSIYQLVDEMLISPWAFEENRPFISVYDIDLIEVAYPSIIVDLNLATFEELQSAGLTTSQANAVVNARVNGYTFKSLGEIQMLPGFSMSDMRLHEIADNIRVGFGDGWNSWNWNNRPVFVNINTATRDELWHLGFTEQQVNQLLQRRGRMSSANDLPFDVSSFDDSITLFTNINMATPQEWMSLDVDITHDFARTLSEEARFNPFGSWRELRDFFYDNGNGEIYRRIRWFLVLR